VKRSRLEPGSATLRALCGALALLAFTALAPAAQAAQTRVKVNSFGALDNPSAVAIDQSSGDLYVADTANHRIEKFDEAGNFLLAFGADVGGPGVDTCTSSCQPGTAGADPGAFEEPKFLAVDDDSSSPSFHDVYVADTADNLISKFDSEGNLIASWGNNGPLGTPDGQLDGPPSGAFVFLGGIAVDSSGVLNANEGFLENQATRQYTIFRFTEDGSFASEVTLHDEFGTRSRGLALDAAGDIFKVQGDGQVKEFDPAGNEVGLVTPERAINSATALAIEPASGDLYVATPSGTDHYAFNGAGEVLQAGGGTCKVEPESLSFHGCDPTDSLALPFGPAGIDVNSASGETYLSDPAAGEVDVYSALLTIPDATTEAATEVGAHKATLNGTVDPAGLQVTECFFEYLSEAERERNETEGKAAFAGAAQAPCVPAAAAIPADSSPHTVEAKITGLNAGTAYHFRLIAANANDAGAVPNPGADLLLHTSPPPSIDEATATEVGEHSATLNAKVNPRGFATSCSFEYGTDTSYGLGSVPCEPANLGSGTADVSVLAHLEGLSPNFTYHWRVHAESENGEAPGVDHTFVFLTEPEGSPPGSCPANEALRTGPSAHLPDCRAYELVTPPRKNGALIGNVTFVGIQPDVASDGSRVIAGSIQCFAGATSCQAQHGDGVGSPYAFTRTSNGWLPTALAPSAAEFPLATPWGYNADSGAALFSMSTLPQGEDDFYKREADSSFVDVGPVTPPELGAQGPIGGKVRGIEQVHTAGFSHFAWETEARWPFDQSTGGAQFNAYEYAGVGNAQPLLVGVSGGQGSTDLISICGTNLGSDITQARPGTMSEDGRTVYFTALTEGGGTGVRCPSGSGTNAGTPVPANAIYARIDGERSDAHTVAISNPSPSECGGGEAAAEKACREAAGKPAGAEFFGASADGSKAFFASTQQLTDAASEDSHSGDNASRIAAGCELTTGPNGCNLYLYDSNQPAGHHLIAISAGDTSGLGPEVQGVMAFSPDGSHIYFVARGVLAANQDENGELAEPAADNLYVYKRDATHPAGHTAFIATLPGSDREEWDSRPGQPANVTPDGRFLVFTSHGQLTPDATSRSGAAQVYRYDAETEALTRVSIGERGFDDNGNRSTATPCAVNACSEDARIVAAVGNSRSDPTMSDAGSRVFFQSPLGLTPGASNDVQIGSGEEGIPVYVQNIYEWEPQGSGCAEAGGCLSLVSGGNDTSVNAGAPGACTHGGVSSSVCLLGTDTSGENVFFTTTDQLVPQDTDSELDFYGAHVAGGFAHPAESEICLTADACHGEGTQEGPQPSAATPGFNGPGNLHQTKCKKGFVKKHGRCVKKHIRRHRKKHRRPHRRASDNRRADG
jgi:DNA-binding beta-propeller fold protein YncE